MKAVVLDGFGDADRLKIAEAQEPILNQGEVLLATTASGVNGADLLQRKGHYPAPKGASEILGLEVSGVIEKLDEIAAKAGWKVGDRVMALLSGGGYAQKVAIRHDQLMRVPPSVDLKDAGGIVEVFVTAYLELCILGELQRGEKVLIHAGASGVGTAAIQIAKAIGAEVWVTTSSQEKIDFCLKLGADHGINYRSENFAEKVSGVDVVLDLVGATHLAKNLAVLGLNGRLLLVGLGGGRKTEIDLGLVLAKRIRIIGSTLRSRSLEDKAEIIRRFWNFAEGKFASGEFSPVIDRVFGASEVVEAHKYLESQKNRGKVLLHWDQG